MERIILEAKNKEELEALIKRNIILKDDETYTIKELKKPSSFLFFKTKGKYEITLVSKNDIKETKQVKQTKVKEDKKPKFEKKIEKKEEFKANKEIKTETTNYDDEIVNIVKTKIERFIEAIQLDIKLVSVEKRNRLVFVNLEGSEVKYIIGEKGQALNSIEFLFNSLKEFKNIRVILDANGYRKKRENSLINLANKKARKVIETKSYCKLSPMSSKERRVIHEELSKYSELETESHGVEPKRYLVIKYVGERNE